MSFDTNVNLDIANKEKSIRYYVTMKKMIHKTQSHKMMKKMHKKTQMYMVHPVLGVTSTKPLYHVIFI